ncbi:MAG TPA: galactokinase [Nocardioidaceae bacterium]|nr:galactokinase [Nocardioidaceae bacterium]
MSGQVPGPAERAAKAFGDLHGQEPAGVWFAPGRVNLIGEHTDYNDGFVLPLALPQGVAAAGRRRDDAILRVRSGQVDEPVEVALADLAPGALDGWGAYPAAAAWALRSAGLGIGGADLVLDSDVPSGAGLSSSHALQCAVALALLGLADLELDRTQIAKLVRTAENDFVGAPTGIMDQMASLHGRAGHLTFLDTRTLVVEHVLFDLDAAGLALLVIDSRAPHALVDGEYAERRASCEAAAAELGVPALRDVSLDELPEALARLEDPVAARRARHVVTENDRVLTVVATLRAGRDPREIGPLLTASHTSLRDDFEVTVPQVDTAVEAALSSGAWGSRMTGGGFGGCVLALVDTDRVGQVVVAVEEAYRRAGFTPPAAFVARASEGARRVR